MRGRIPAGAEVVGTADDLEYETYDQGVRTAVEFATEVQPGETRTLTCFVRMDETPGGSTFGPIEVSSDGEQWAGVGGTVDSNGNAGVGGL